MKTVSIIGMGRVGRALDMELNGPFEVRSRIGRVGSDHGITALELVEQIDSDIIFITTNDDSIGEVVSIIAGKVSPNTVILHTSGSLSSAVLNGLRTESTAIGSMHPLVSITKDARPGVFNGAYFCVEGEPKAVEVAIEIAVALGGKPFSMPTANKPLYHAAAVTAAGHIVALIDIADEMMRAAGVDDHTSLQALMPLVRSAVRNVEAIGTGRALTGTYARGDVQTAKQHIEAVSAMDDANITEVFLSLAKRSVGMQSAEGLDDPRITSIERLLAMAKRDAEL